MDEMKSLYEQMGGEAALHQLVQKFYQQMDALPETQGIRAMHPTDLGSAEEKLFMFLSGWLGGPSLFIERFGHPRLRMRHLPFSIGESERDQWMHCMRDALDTVVREPSLREELYASLYDLADFMRNCDG